MLPLIGQAYRCRSSRSDIQFHVRACLYMPTTVCVFLTIHTLMTHCIHIQFLWPNFIRVNSLISAMEISNSSAHAVLPTSISSWFFSFYSLHSLIYFFRNKKERQRSALQRPPAKISAPPFSLSTAPLTPASVWPLHRFDMPMRARVHKEAKIQTNRTPNAPHLEIPFFPNTIILFSLIHINWAPC